LDEFSDKILLILSAGLCRRAGSVLWLLIRVSGRLDACGKNAGMMGFSWQPQVRKCWICCKFLPGLWGQKFPHRSLQGNHEGLCSYMVHTEVFVERLLDAILFGSIGI
jgi:hypothetical protein